MFDMFSFRTLTTVFLWVMVGANNSRNEVIGHRRISHFRPANSKNYVAGTIDQQNMSTSSSAVDQEVTPSEYTKRNFTENNVNPIDNKKDTKYAPIQDTKTHKRVSQTKRMASSQSPPMSPRIQLSLSIGVQDIGVEKSSSSLMIDHSNQTENSELTLQNTLAKIRKDEILRTTTNVIMNLLNEEVDNLIVRTKPVVTTSSHSGSNRTLLLKGRLPNNGDRNLKIGTATFILLENLEAESSLNKAGDSGATVDFEWFHVKLTYSVWYEEMTFEYDSEEEIESNGFLPKKLDKEKLESLRQEVFAENDTGALLDQLNDVISNNIASQKLIQLLNINDNSFVSVSQIGGEEGAIRFSLPSSPPTSESDATLTAQSSESKLNYFTPLDTRKMSAVQSSGLVLFVITLFASVYVYRTSRNKKKYIMYDKQEKMSLASEQGTESILEHSQTVPPYMNQLETVNENHDICLDSSPVVSSWLASAKLERHLIT